MAARVLAARGQEKEVGDESGGRGQNAVSTDRKNDTAQGEIWDIVSVSSQDTLRPPPTPHPHPLGKKNLAKSGSVSTIYFTLGDSFFTV